MIVKHYELKNNLKENVNYFLLYGQNIGLIEELIDKNLKPIFSKNIFKYDETEILSDLDGFKEGLFNKSFFESDKLIIINRASDKILDIIKEISQKKDGDLKIILKSSNLEKKSKLRNFFEKGKDLIIVPFYEDNYQSLLFLAQNFFKENKIKISTQNINYIIENSKGNRISLKNELEKIKNFSQKKLSIEFSEIIKLINLAENYSLSELTDQCLAKNKKKTLNILNENNPSPEDNILLIKNFLYKLKRLKKLKLELENNKNIETVISSYKPPIFWKDKDIIKQQLKVWTLPQIKSLISKTNDMELLIKRNSQVSNLIVNNFILEKL
jgi:DNA polymerase-3 subunit delta